VSGAEETGSQKWTFSTRVIAGDIIDRARWRTVVLYQAFPRVTLGVEYNPLADDVNPLVNLLVFPEGDYTPAVMMGTSSDRIGTESGTAFFATASKDLEGLTCLPIAPYVGASYGTFDDELVPIGGLNIRIGEHLRASAIFDGKKVHPMLSWGVGRHDFGVLLAFGELETPGVFYSVRF